MRLDDICFEALNARCHALAKQVASQEITIVNQKEEIARLRYLNEWLKNQFIVSVVG